MPEAVIVATARSPIGRAGKGSLVDIRPDDLTAQIVRAALDKVPQLDPTDIDDLMLGCGLPGGEQGFNMGRVVAVCSAMDHLPGCTITRYCSSQPADHPDGDARDQGRRGRRAASRPASRRCPASRSGSSDSWPDTRNPYFADAEARTAAVAANGADAWHDPRPDGDVPDVYIAMGQTAENLARVKNVSREEMDEFGVRVAEPGRGGDRRRASGSARSRR